MIKLIKEGYDDTYYEVVSEVDGIPNTIVRKDDDVKFRVVRRDNKNGYQIKAMWYDKDQKMGQWDYSKEYYDTPEEASDAMTKFTATFRNLPKEINESITVTEDLAGFAYDLLDRIKLELHLLSEEESVSIGDVNELETLTRSMKDRDIKYVTQQIIQMEKDLQTAIKYVNNYSTDLDQVLNFLKLR